MTKITIERSLIEQAIEALPDVLGMSHFPLRTKLRAALAEPSVGPTAVFYRCNHCNHAYEDHPPSSCDCLTGCEFERVEYFASPPPPANVPLLTQDDIVQIILSSKHLPLGDAIRLTEKVVRQKAGLK